MLARRPDMTDQAIEPATEATTFTDVERRIKAILIGSAGNLVEWYDFYAYTAFALYFAPAFFPSKDPEIGRASCRERVKTWDRGMGVRSKNETRKTAR